MSRENREGGCRDFREGFCNVVCISALFGFSGWGTGGGSLRGECCRAGLDSSGDELRGVTLQSWRSGKSTDKQLLIRCVP